MNNKKYFVERGDKFGRLLVLDIPKPKRLLCKCDCGTVKDIYLYDVVKGKTKSCGCLLRETTIERYTKHGHSTTKCVTSTYSIWASMLDRCRNVKNKAYKNYGGRGITICKEWEQFENFLKDMGERPEGLSIERRNNNKGYSKENCIWATSLEQTRNKRGNVYIEFEGKRQVLTDWAKELGIHQSSLRHRLKHWDFEKAMTTPHIPLNKRNEKDIT